MQVLLRGCDRDPVRANRSCQDARFSAPPREHISLACLEALRVGRSTGANSIRLLGISEATCTKLAHIRSHSHETDDNDTLQFSD
jgi:hypothetical protein